MPIPQTNERSGISKGRSGVLDRSPGRPGGGTGIKQAIAGVSNATRIPVGGNTQTRPHSVGGVSSAVGSRNSVRTLDAFGSPDKSGVGSSGRTGRPGGDPGDGRKFRQWFERVDGGKLGNTKTLACIALKDTAGCTPIGEGSV